ncbi:tetratricopeptide repeat protein [Streptosporangium amethystogenes]|uniref:tetratricopeptide repeat protein n=1 Tax=Streptosporangium amethystogenes TaxID=2002 RepID=UPI001B807BE5|nr:hypothetical protein [Streptosporangium amethystogenes]
MQHDDRRGVAEPLEWSGTSFLMTVRVRSRSGRAADAFFLQRGMTELHLDNWPKAIDLLTDGLSSLPESYKRDRAWYGSCLAKAHAEAGDVAAAVQVSLPIVADAVELNRHAAKELLTIARDLNRKQAPEAVTLSEALMACSSVSE